MRRKKISTGNRNQRCWKGILGILYLGVGYNGWSVNTGWSFVVYIYIYIYIADNIRKTVRQTLIYGSY
jgi:hypothetical protein